MALKGIDIFKLSPKTNCGDCGFSTCMAFCMKAAQGAVMPEQCPHFSASGLEKLQAMSRPAMAKFTVAGLPMGGETVLYRHEKTLVSPNGFGITLDDTMTDEALAQALQQLQAVDYSRIGQRMYVEFVQLRCLNADPERYAALARAVKDLGRCPVLSCRQEACARAALQVLGGECILNGATPENYRQMAELALRYGAALGAWAPSLAQLHTLSQQLEALGVKRILLDITGENEAQTLENAVQVRRGALKDGIRAFGYPSLVDIAALAPADPSRQSALAALFVQRYGSVLLLEKLSYAQALPLFGLRQNIYTDPQKPMKVEAKAYPLCGGGADSPWVLTVDFALTYFLVSAELERAGEPVNLLVADASGMSVLTAWAAGKLTAASIAQTVQIYGPEKGIFILPGKVGVLQQQVQRLLPGWQVVTGPDEAAQLPRYMKSRQYLTDAAALAAEQKEAAVEDSRSLSFDRLLHSHVPAIEKISTDVHYPPRNPNSKRFVVIGERIHCIAPAIREAMDRRDPAPILQRAEQQIAAGATYLDVNIGPAEEDGAQRMMWAVKLLQENFGNVPLALDTVNRRAIEAGLYVYNRANGKPILNSADNGARRSIIDLAAANDAIVIALCAGEGLVRDNEERLYHCHQMLERGLSLGMAAEDLWFDPSFLVIKGMQEQQVQILEAIRLMSAEGLKTTGGVSNCSNGVPRPLRPILDSAMLAMCMSQGMTSAILNPNDSRMMQTVKACDIIHNRVLYNDELLKD